MAVPEMTFSPEQRMAVLKFGPVTVKVTEDDAGLYHVQTDDKPTTVRRGTEVLHDDTPPPEEVDALVEARTPVITLEDKVRDAVGTQVSSSTTQEEMVQLSAREAARLVTEPGA